MDRAYARCEEILTRRRQELELTARYLLVHETMSGEIFQKVFTDPAAPELALPEEDQPGPGGLSAAAAGRWKDLPAVSYG